MATEKKSAGFENNESIKPCGYRHHWTEEQINEYRKCKKSYEYFMCNYVLVTNIDGEQEKFVPRWYQKEALDLIHQNQKTILEAPRQSGKTVCVQAYLLWMSIFHKNQKILILANKNEKALDVMSIFKSAYEELPIWLQSGVKTWSVHTIVLENGSRIKCTTTTPTSGRGSTISCLYIDEVQFVPENIWKQFYASAYPTISSSKSKKAKIIMSSTPQGLNHWHKLVEDAKAGKTEFKYYLVPWRVDGRDDKFREATINELGLQTWLQEYECVSGDTTVSYKDPHGNTFNAPIIELYKKMNGERGMDLFEAHASGYKIKAKSGWEDFHGVRKVQSRTQLSLTLFSGHTLRCSPDHMIETEDGFKPAKSLTKQCRIITEDGSSKINNRSIQFGRFDLYDALHTDSRTYLTNGISSHNCEHQGSSDTLIPAAVIANLVTKDPIRIDGATKYYEEPDPERDYAIMADIALGRGGDYDFSIGNIFDITELPYRQVAVFRDNQTSTTAFQEILNDLGAKFNDALILVENNKSRGVAETLDEALGYPRLLYAQMMGRKGQVLKFHKTKKSQCDYGMAMSQKTKTNGCLSFKTMMENGTLTTCDAETHKEIERFIRKGGTWTADASQHDDIVMTCVMFQWMVGQEEFKDYAKADARQIFLNKTEGFEKRSRDDGLRIKRGYFDGTDSKVSHEVINGEIWTVKDMF